MTEPSDNYISEEEYMEEPEDMEPEQQPIPVEKKKRTKKDRSPKQQEAFAKCIAARKKKAEEQLKLKDQREASHSMYMGLYSLGVPSLPLDDPSSD